MDCNSSRGWYTPPGVAGVGTYGGPQKPHSLKLTVLALSHTEGSTKGLYRN